MRRKAKLKKLLALCLVLAMVLSMNVTVFADDSAGTSDTSQISQTTGSGDSGNTSAGSTDPAAPSSSDGGVQTESSNDSANSTPAAQTDTEGTGGSGSGAQDAATYVAQVGDKPYGTLQAAIDAVTGSEATTVTLLQDAAESITVSADKNIVLDLNDKTLTNEAGKDTITVDLGATLEVKGTGTVDNVSHQSAAVVNNGTAILSGGSYTRSQEASTSTEGANGNSYYNILNHGDMTINDNVSVISSGVFSSLIDNGYYNYTSTNPRNGYVNGTNQAEPKLVINGGTFSGGINTIKNDDAATVTINGGTFSNVTQAVLFNTNIATVNGGNFEAKNGKAVIDNQTYRVAPNLSQLTVTGGTFKGKVYSGTEMTIEGGSFTGSITQSEDGELVISGGTFVNENNQPLDVTAYLAEGCKMDESGVVTKYVAQIGEKDYETFAEAYGEAQENDTIKVLADADWVNEVTGTKGYELKITKSLTIDLNGHTLTPVYAKSNGIQGAYLELNTEGKKLTIQDTSEKENGVLTTSHTSYIVRLNNGNLTLESGTLKTEGSSRAVYVYNANSTFTMNGGTLVNGRAKENTALRNVLDVESGGTAIIHGGLIQSTNESDPVPGARLNHKSSSLIVDGGTFETGTAAAIVKTAEGTLTVTGGTFSNQGPSISITAGGAATIGSDEENAKEFTLPKLALGQSGVVDVKNNVIVKEVTAIPVSGSTDYTFKFGNKFGGQYGNEFTSNIIGNGLYCAKSDDSEYYTVDKIIDEEDPRIVAKITHSDKSIALFGDFGAAMTALQNGDTLTLKKNVENNNTKSSWLSTASNVTINLNSYSIKSKSNYGLYFKPDYKKITGNDVVKIQGTGKIQGTQYAIYCTANTTDNSEYPIYTLSIEQGITLEKTDTNTTHYPVGLYSQQTRLYLDAAQKDTDYNYAAVTNAAAKTTIDGKTYVYYHPDRALNDQTGDGGVVTLVNDCFPGVLKVNSSYTLTLDMNGRTLKSTKPQALIANGAGLTIKNGTIEHAYGSQSASVAIGMIANDSETSSSQQLKLENVTINSSAKKVTAVNISGNLTGVQVTLKGCTINCDEATSTSTVGVYFPIKDGKLDIIDTSITAHNALQVKGGTVTVKEDNPGKTVLTSTGAKADPAATSSGCTNTGDGIYVEDTYGFKPIVNVLSGTIKSTGEGTSALRYFDNQQENATGRIEVSGGYFSNEVPVDYCASGYTPTTTKDENGMYTVEKPAATVYGATLTLNGTIGVNFYVDMNSVEAADQSSYSMKFTVNGAEPTATSFDANACRTFNGTKYYRFSCPVAAKQMTDTITAQLYKADKAVSKEYTYSVKKYCDNAIEKSGDVNLVSLMKAMLNYGGYAQRYFNYNTGNLANTGLFDATTNPVEDVNAEALESYDCTTTGTKLEGINLGATLLLESDTTIRFYIDPDDQVNIGDYAISLDGKTCTPIKNSAGNSVSDAEYYVEVPNIAAQDLGTSHTLTISKGTENYSVSYSALSYAYNTLSAGEEVTDNLKNTVKALYLYHKAATEYTGWLTN